MDCFVALLLAMTERRYRILAPHCARASLKFLIPQNRGSKKCRALAASRLEAAEIRRRRTIREKLPGWRKASACEWRPQPAPGRRRDTQFYLRQDSGGLSELTVGIGDDFPQRMLGGFGSLFSQLQTFRCALAHRMSTGFDFSRFVLDAVENFSGLINQIDSVSASGCYPGAHKAQYIFVCATGRPSISMSHEKTPASIG
jgi:hypothetical protein